MAKENEKFRSDLQTELLFHELQYTPDTEIRIHENTIRLICAPFQSHENGLPEWVKNSADAYAREDAPESRRIIIVIFDYGQKNTSPSISCLDLVGMNGDDIDGNFNYWGSPEAAGRGTRKATIQGGHGNGGKCYMTQMFSDYARIHTVKNLKKSCYGVPGGKINFGYIPDKETGRDCDIDDLNSELDSVLKPLRCSIDLLPNAAKKSIESADGFSLITGYGPKGYEKNLPIRQLIRTLQNHNQMLRTLEMCKVYIVINGKIANARKPLTLPAIKPLKDGELPREMEIPSKLRDPYSDNMVSTTEGGKFHRGTLILNTSEKSMRYGGMKHRHTIRFRGGQYGDFGFVRISELNIQSSFKDHLYGMCELESLEQYKQNNRARLAESPLTRAVEFFISDQIQAYAKEFEARAKRKYSQQEKTAINEMNEALNAWKNRFLNELLQGAWGEGTDGPPPPPPPLQSGKAARIELRLSHSKSGKGISMRPLLHFFNDKNQRIQAVPHKWVSDDNNIAMVDNDLLLIETFSFGETSIRAETLNGKISSNSVPIEVVHIKEIKIEPEILEVSQGSREKLRARCTLFNGEESEDVLLSWIEDDASIARVSSAGFVFGFKQGETSVVAGDDCCIVKKPVTIRAVSGKGSGAGEKSGKGYPRVLISGINLDPDTNEPVEFLSDDPPVLQRVEDISKNIWWINSSAPLATLYLDKAKDYGYESREWRMYHLERYIDIIVQILLIHQPEEQKLFDVNDWIMRWMSKVAEIQLHACSELFQFIANGDLSFVN